MLVIDMQYPVAVDDIGAIPTVRIAIDRHQSERVAGEERRLDRAIVDLEVGVAIQHPEGIAEQGRGLPQRATRPEQARPVLGVMHREPESGPASDMRADLLAEIA